MARVALNASSWPELMQDLKDDLEFNPLDAETPPTQAVADTPDPMAWVVDGNRDPDKNPDGKNSLALQLQLNKWELDPPDMYAKLSPLPTHNELHLAFLETIASNVSSSLVISAGYF